MVLTRLAILESDGAKWKEVLLCDEHLKNSNGFLGGTPSGDVSAWRVQFEKDPQKGLLLFFIPYNQGPAIPDPCDRGAMESRGTSLPGHGRDV